MENHNDSWYGLLAPNTDQWPLHGKWNDMGPVCRPSGETLLAVCSCDGSHGGRYSKQCPASLRLLSVLGILSPVSGMSNVHLIWPSLKFSPLPVCWSQWVTCPEIPSVSCLWTNVTYPEYPGDPPCQMSWGSNHKIQSPLSRNNGRDLSLYVKPSLNSKEQWTNPWPQPLWVFPSKLPQ